MVVAGAISRGDSSAPGVPAGHIASENASTGGDGYEAGYMPGGRRPVRGVQRARDHPQPRGHRRDPQDRLRVRWWWRRLLRANSTWNTPIPAGATFVDEPSLRSGGGWFNADAFGTPFIRSSPTDREVTVTYPNNSWGWAGTTVHAAHPRQRVRGDRFRRVAVGARSEHEPGARLLAVRPGHRHARPATAQAYARSNVVTEDGWSIGSRARCGIHASGSALIAGAILNNELTAGINHTCAVAIRKNLCNRWVHLPVDQRRRRRRRHPQRPASRHPARCRPCPAG